MKVDQKKLIQDVNIWNVVQRLNIETSYGQKGSYPDTDKILVKSPFRNDHSLGSCQLTITGRYKGWFKDWAEGTSVSFVNFVAAAGNMPWYEAERFIAEDVGGIEDYYIPGTETEFEKVYGIIGNDGKRIRANKKFNEIQSSKYHYDFPALLSTSDLKLIGLDEYQEHDKINNCKIIRQTYFKPQKWELEENEFFITQEQPNPNYKEDSQPEYLSFLDFINNKPNPDIHASSEKPFVTVYLICQYIQNDKINDLYKNDKFSYFQLINRKIRESLNNIEDALNQLNGKIDRISANQRAFLKNQRRQIKKIQKTYTLSDEDCEQMIKEYIENNYNEDISKQRSQSLPKVI